MKFLGFDWIKGDKLSLEFHIRIILNHETGKNCNDDIFYYPIVFKFS